MTLLEKQIAHNNWANRTWIRFLADAGSGDEFLLGRMSHILLGERVWFQRIAGEAPDRDIWRRLPAADLIEMQSRHEEMFERLLAADLARVVRYTRFTGEQYQSTVADLLTHLALHGMHHRGQMSVRSSQVGVTPPNVDFVQFCLTHGV
jgi:uncharacterized damage-inducible protein DinB